ncbi:MAG: AIR synthase related protein, partial [Planctomycetota bacterium]
QYDHEVQGGSVVKPLTGIDNDGPSDAAVIQPKLNSDKGLAISCGMNPLYGDIDPYWMALAGIDEAIRNLVCVGGRADRIALLDNFCWGDCTTARWPLRRLSSRARIRSTTSSPAKTAHKYPFHRHC